MNANSSPQNVWRERAERGLIWLAVGLVVLSFLAVARHAAPGFDEEMYALLSRGAYTQTFLNYPDNYGNYGPIGHYALGLIQYLYGPSLTAGRQLAALIGIATVFAVPRSFRTPVGGRPELFAYCVLLLASPMLFELYARYTYYSIFGLALLITLVTLHRLEARPLYALAFAALCALLPYIRHTNLFFAVIAGAAGAWKLRGSWQSLLTLSGGYLASNLVLMLLFPAYSHTMWLLNFNQAGLPWPGFLFEADPPFPGGTQIMAGLAAPPDSSERWDKLLVYALPHTPVLTAFLGGMFFRAWTLYRRRALPDILDGTLLLLAGLSLYALLWLPVMHHGLYAPQYLVYAYPVFLVFVWRALAESDSGLRARWIAGALIAAVAIAWMAVPASGYRQSETARSFSAVAGLALPSFSSGEAPLSRLRRTSRELERAIPARAKVWYVGYAYAIANLNVQSQVQVMNQYYSFVPAEEDLTDDPRYVAGMNRRNAFDQFMFDTWLREDFEYVAVPELYLDRWWNPAAFDDPPVQASARAYRETLRRNLELYYEEIHSFEGWDGWLPTQIRIYRRIDAPEPSGN